MIIDLVRTTDKALPAFPDPAGVTALRVWFCGYTSLAALAGLRGLRTVVVASYPDDDLSALAALEHLEYLLLAELPNLAHLELFGVRPASRSLADLERSSSLRTVRVSKYPEREVSRYRAASGTSDALAPGPGVADWY